MFFEEVSVLLFEFWFEKILRPAESSPIFLNFQMKFGMVTFVVRVSPPSAPKTSKTQKNISKTNCESNFEFKQRPPSVWDHLGSPADQKKKNKN